MSSLASRAAPFVGKLMSGGSVLKNVIKGLKGVSPTIIKGLRFGSRVLQGASKVGNRAIQTGEKIRQGVDIAKGVGLIPKGESEFDRKLSKGISRGRNIQGNIDVAAGKVRSGQNFMNRFNPLQGFS